ncbi:hypothetical protein [Aeromonas hydrophila]|uniref:hypothetical protein n=1 Tax=Aeromonas hydrophila TaxID=644 RepID=UPI003EC86895
MLSIWWVKPIGYKMQKELIVEVRRVIPMKCFIFELLRVVNRLSFLFFVVWFLFMMFIHYSSSYDTSISGMRSIDIDLYNIGISFAAGMAVTALVCNVLLKDINETLARLLKRDS